MKRPSPIVIAELVAMVAAALLLATVGAILGALGDRSTTDDPLDDPPPTKPSPPLKKYGPPAPR